MREKLSLIWPTKPIVIGGWPKKKLVTASIDSGIMQVFWGRFSFLSFFCGNTQMKSKLSRSKTGRRYVGRMWGFTGSWERDSVTVHLFGCFLLPFFFCFDFVAPSLFFSEMDTSSPPPSQLIRLWLVIFVDYAAIIVYPSFFFRPPFSISESKKNYWYFFSNGTWKVYVVTTTYPSNRL